ncbi:MAG TPA: ATP-binding protein [Propioniciclava tarda]|nr:ATP-binding protein [Propioniciclava tarda]HQD61066.1 ATP-binding protein [Propioniciclava tarda]
MHLLQRAVRPWVSELLSTSPIVVVEGARQVGKSTLVGMVAPETAVHATMDDDVTRAFASDDPVGFLRSAGPAGLLTIDEIQRCPELILPLKAEVDRDRRPGRFLLTGSANLLRLPGAEDSLAGRAMTVRLRPFAQDELLGEPSDWVTSTLSGSPPAAVSSDRRDVVERLVTGGYPVVQGLTPRVRVAWLRDYANRLVQRDAADVASAHVATLRKLLSLIAAAPMGELVGERLAEALGVARATALRHLEILEALFLVERVPSWSRSLTSRQIQRPKVLLTDSGLAAALSGMSADHLASPRGSDHLGLLLENFVACELMRQQGWSATEFELSHYRDRHGAEVDIIVETPQGVLGVEVKSATVARAGHFKNLIQLRDRLGSEFLAGVVLTTGTGQRAGDRLMALPVDSLWTSKP